MRRVLSVVAAVVLLASCAPNETEEPSGTPWPAATPNESATPGPAIAKLDLFAKFASPMSMRALEGSNEWVVAERAGKVWRYDGDDRELVLDISDKLLTEAEQGLFDFVVGPDGEHAYVHYSGREKPYADNHIDEYAWNGRTVEGEPREVLVVEHPYIHHYGGQLQFGPDEMLYIAIGDGGTKELAQEPENGDPHGNGQGVDELLGNVLRINPRPSGSKAYTVPDDNPFVAKDGEDEIWAYGLRNPWRFSFDRKAGDMWLPDVGHRFWEEINVIEAKSKGGQNFGWSLLEGEQRYKGDAPKDHADPVYVYPHRGGPCAIVGGYVYRGDAIPEIKGSYVFGDFCTGQIQAIRVSDGELKQHVYLGPAVEQLSSFAEDRDGELFALSLSKGVYRIEPR